MIWWHRTLRWRAASCWVECNAWTRHQLRALSTPKPHSLLVSRFFMWMFMVGDSMIFALPAICDPSSRLRARLLGRQLKGRQVLEWWGERYFKREWSAGGEERGVLHKQPPERPLLHLHLVSEIVHLASHKYQQFMDVAKVCTYTLICFLSHFFLSRMKRSSWREVINTLTIIWFIFSLVLRMKRSSWQEVSNTTGCLPRCSHTRYTWKLRKKSKVIHSSNINLEVRKTV